MPYDYNGRHATGREVYRLAADGIHWGWFPEYEGDDTEGLPVTDPDYDITHDPFPEWLWLYPIQDEYGDILSEETMSLVNHVVGDNMEIAKAIYKALEEAQTAGSEKGYEEGRSYERDICWDLGI